MIPTPNATAERSIRRNRRARRIAGLRRF